MGVPTSLERRDAVISAFDRSRSIFTVTGIAQDSHLHFPKKHPASYALYLLGSSN